MKVSEEVIQKISLTMKCRNRLAMDMNVSQASIERWIKENKENGKLTTTQAVDIISQEIGVSKKQVTVK